MNMNHKVGIKLLSETQLENVLPNYENLLNKINICRVVAKNVPKEDRKEHYQYKLMYDNVFSIMGKRGTGKTSVAFTLKQKLEKEYGKKYGDVILPLIIPEVIPEESSILGWLLAIVGEAVKDLDDALNDAKVWERNGSQYWKECQYLANSSVQGTLTAKLEEILKLFYAGSYNPANEDSYYRAIGNSIQQSRDYYKFAREISSFWDEWVERIKEQRRIGQLDCENKDDVSCPLIYFIFDDVDLAPEKIQELLSIIIKYLSHPNIIVITTADEELFLEVIERQLDNKVGRIPKEWRNYLNTNTNRDGYWDLFRDMEKEVSFQDLSSKTARMYLGKVLPTSTRYYLQLFSTARQKEMFYLEDEKNLGSEMAEQVEFLMHYMKEGTNLNNFMKVKNEVIFFYFKFMGDTSRQIGNASIALKELVFNLGKIAENTRREEKSEEITHERNIYRVYQDCKYFLCVAINANHELSEVIEYTEEFVNNTFLVEYNDWMLYINYFYLNSFLQKKNQNMDIRQKIDIGLQLYSLFAVVENMLLIMEHIIPGGITNRKKVHVVPYLTEYVNEVVFQGRTMFRYDLEANVYFKHYMNLLDRLDTIVEDGVGEAKFNIEYFYDFKSYISPSDNKMSAEGLLDMKKKNEKWFNELTGRLFLVYGNVYLFGQEDIIECLIYPRKMFLTSFQNIIQNEIEKNIINSFLPIKLQKEWERLEKVGKSVPEWIVSWQKEFIIKAQDPFYEFSEAIISELKVEERLIGSIGDSVPGRVRLDQILNVVIKKMMDLIKARHFQQFFLNCPEDIKQTLMEVVSGDSREQLREVMREQAQLIMSGKMELGQERMVYNPLNALEVMQKLMERIEGIDFSACEQLRQIGKEMYDIVNAYKRNVGEGMSPKPKVTEIIISNRAYVDLIRILNQKKWFDGQDGEEMQIYHQCEEVIASLDIIVNIDNRGEVQQAIELGIRVAFFELLQRLYICRTIYERYKTQYSLSSAGLEKESKSGRDTYYFSMFNCLVDFLRNKDRDVLKQDDKNIRDDIRSNYRRERMRYVNSLLRGAEDE